MTVDAGKSGCAARSRRDIRGGRPADTNSWLKHNIISYSLLSF